MIHVPAAPGGGWDLTASVMRSALLDESLTREVTLVHSPGAGGLIGLAQFVEGKKGNGQALLVGGMVMIGAAAINQSKVSLLDTTPIARLTMEPVVVAVPSSSPIKSLDALIEIMVRRPALVSWVGGSRGGADHLVLLGLQRALGVVDMPYHALPGGGVAEALASGRFTAGVSGYSQLEGFVRNGQLRILALSADSPMPEFGIPTFKELGIDLSLINWRGVFAAPSITKEQAACWAVLIDQMIRSTSWKEATARHQWQDAYLSGPDFDAFLRSQLSRTMALDELLPDPTARPALARILTQRYSWLMGAIVVAFVLGILVVRQEYTNRRKEGELARALAAAHAQAQRNAERLHAAEGGLGDLIEAEFSNWGLSVAERDVALLMLKGLRLKQIAAMRDTSERTVRQQALAIYRKAGLDGRSDLAAHFLESISTFHKRA